MYCRQLSQTDLNPSEDIDSGLVPVLWRTSKIAAWLPTGSFLSILRTFCLEVVVSLFRFLL